MIDDDLLRVMSAHAGSPQAFARSPAPISGGYWAAIYGFELDDPPAGSSGRLVLRVMPNASSARIETIVHRSVVEQGYPTPRVLLDGFDEGLGGAFIVMERVEGAQLLEGLRLGGALLSLPKILRRIARQLSVASVRLHDLDPQPVRVALEEAGIDPDTLGPQARLGEIRAVARTTSVGLDGVLAWLENRRPPFTPAVVCHGDIHPFNMLVGDDDSFNLLDWTNGCLCRREYDVGCTAALLHCAPIAVPRLAEGALRAVTGSLAHRFVDMYRKLAPINLDVVEWFETLQYARCIAAVASAALDDPIVGAKHPFRISAPAMIRQLRMITDVTVELR
jgi:aminoglycoside phosphotransferase (APT) family kinase protein